MPLAEKSTKAGHLPAAKVGKQRTLNPRAQKAKVIAMPDLTEGENFVLDDGPYSIKRRRLIQDRHSSDFVGKSISETPYTPEHVQMREDELKGNCHQRFEKDNLLVETNDGFVLINVIRKGMFAENPSLEAEARASSEAACRDFAKAYPPKTPPVKTDKRYKKVLTEKAKWEEKGQPCGRLHLAVWFMSGHPNEPLRLSSGACPKDKDQLEAVKTYMEKTALEQGQIGEWIKRLDNPAWTKMNGDYQRIRNEGTLKYLDQGTEGIAYGLAFLANLAVQPHKDTDDVRLTWTSTNAWGGYKGAWIVFPELKIMIKQEPGDIVLSKTAYLEHWVTEITEGERFCNTRYSKEKVSNPLDKWVKCPVPDCKVDPMGRVGSLRHHIGKKHKALLDEEVETIIANMASPATMFTTEDAQMVARFLKARVATADRQEKRA